MAEQAVLRVHRMRRAISGSSAAVVRPAVWLLGPPLLLGLLAALIAMQLEGQAWRSKAEVVFRVQPLGPEYMEMQAKLARSQDLASRVVVEAGVPGMTAKRFLRHSSASPPSDTGPLPSSVPTSPAVRWRRRFSRSPSPIGARLLPCGSPTSTRRSSSA
jgi:hypothetical protein